MGLEFAPGTTDDCKRAAARLFDAAEVLGAYRTACRLCRTRDLVLETCEWEPAGFKPRPRREYVENLRTRFRFAGKVLPVLTLTDRSAQQVASLPREAEAFWLVINREGALALMMVLFAAPYATGADAVEPELGVS